MAKSTVSHSLIQSTVAGGVQGCRQNPQIHGSNSAIQKCNLVHTKDNLQDSGDEDGILTAKKTK